jgi:hypothetical protein
MRAEEFTIPKNLAWRIRFKRFSDLDSFLPEREGKMYFMPFDSSALGTFSNLTGKDYEKISKMPTEVYEIPSDAMVYDMKIINSVNNAINYAKKEKNEERKKQYEKMIDYHKKQYLNSGVPYSEYQEGMFDYPEILVDPRKVRKIEDRGVTYDKNTGEIKLIKRKAINEKWSAKYKRSINCNNPKGFSQRAHCQGRKKTNKESVDEVRRDKLGKDVNARFRDAGYKKVGSGIDANVWMKDLGTVVKVIMPELDPDMSINRMQTFYQFAKQHPEIENLPRFKKVDGREFLKFSLGGVPFIQFNMEQLYPLKKGSLDEYVVWFLSGEIDKSWNTAYNNLINFPDFRKKFKNIDIDSLQTYKKFFQVFSLLYKLGRKNKWGWDAHTENVMRRSDGTLVVTDPWA